MSPGHSVFHRRTARPASASFPRAPPSRTHALTAPRPTALSSPSRPSRSWSWPTGPTKEPALRSPPYHRIQPAHHQQFNLGGGHTPPTRRTHLCPARILTDSQARMGVPPTISRIIKVSCHADLRILRRKGAVKTQAHGPAAHRFKRRCGRKLPTQKNLKRANPGFTARSRGPLSDSRPDGFFAELAAASPHVNDQGARSSIVSADWRSRYVSRGWILKLVEHLGGGHA